MKLWIDIGRSLLKSWKKRVLTRKAKLPRANQPKYLCMNYNVHIYPPWDPTGTLMVGIARW